MLSGLITKRFCNSLFSNLARKHTRQLTPGTWKSLPLAPTLRGSQAVSFFTRPVKSLNVSVEGNIASGKTTFIQLLRESGDTDVDVSGVQHQDIKERDLLAKAYGDPVRWSFTLSSYMHLKMLKQHIRPSVKPMKIMEGSLNSTQFCLVENFHKSGYMSDMEYVAINQFMTWMRKTHDLNIGLTVYLQTTPEEVYKRIRKRGRPEEDKITLEYLRALHDLHEDLFVNRKSKFSIDNHVIVIAANQEKEDILEHFLDKLDDISEGIYHNLLNSRHSRSTNEDDYE